MSKSKGKSKSSSNHKVKQPHTPAQQPQPQLNLQMDNFMSKFQPQGQSRPSQNGEPVMTRCYSKSFSLKTYYQPAEFDLQSRPDLRFSFEYDYQTLKTGEVEIQLTFKLTAESQGQIVLESSVTQAAVCSTGKLTDEARRKFIEIAVLKALCPHTCEFLSDVVSRAGLPPVLVAQINFEFLYQIRNNPSLYQGVTSEKELAQAKQKLNQVLNASIAKGANQIKFAPTLTSTLSTASANLSADNSNSEQLSLAPLLNANVLGYRCSYALDLPVEAQSARLTDDVKLAGLESMDARWVSTK